MEIRDLNPSQLDALREIGNIGAGNAASALAQMVSRKIDMTVPNIEIMPFKKVFALIGNEEELVVCVNLQMLGDAQGVILFFFDAPSAYLLIDMLMGQPKNSTNEINDMGASVIQEIGNILSASFLNAIASLTNLQLQPSVPALAIDMLSAVLNTAFIDAGQMDDYAMVITTKFHDDDVSLNGYFFLLPDIQSLEKILNALHLI